MPMVDIQRRHASVFRLRFGDRKNGNPHKLTDAIRVTSASEQVVAAFVDRYGGQVQPFNDPASRDRFEAYLPTDAISIMVLPGQSMSQWWERYKGSVCDRRCDGETETKSGKACMCPADIDQRMADKQACSPTTRVNVLCPDVAVVGSGAFVTHGLIAAETLPQSIAVAEAALDRGLMVPAVLRVVEHKGRNHFVVPQIEIVGVSLHELATGNGGQLVGVAEPRAVTAGELAAPAFSPVPASLPEAPTPSVKEQMAAVTSPPQRKPRSNAAAPLPATGLKPRTAAEAAEIDDAKERHPSGRVCGKCGGSLVGQAVRMHQGGYVHDTCPGSGGDAPPPVATEGGESPVAPVAAGDPPTLNLGGEPPLVAGGDNSPPNQLAGNDEVRLVGILAGKVLRPWFDLAPKGKKTETVDRIRHTLTHAVTGHTSLKACTTEELVKVDRELRMIQDGSQTLEVLEDGISLTNGQSERLIEWADQ